MARKQIRMEQVLEFAATARGRATVFWAAISLAVCHIVALSTEQAAANLNGSLQQQLIHFGAVFFRFVLPCAVMTIGLVTYLVGKSRKSAASSRPHSP
jgi:hypothetical protein